MDKDNTILYNIAYQDGYASRIIPELEWCGNAAPRRFERNGETISLMLNNTIDKISAYCSSPFVSFKVTSNYIAITFKANPTTSTRQARININKTDGSGTNKLLQFVVHQK